MEFTKGPWRAVGLGSEGYAVFVDVPGRKFPLRAVPRIDGLSWEEGKGNAQLIAAAPDMYEALKDIESKITDFEAGKINWRPDDFLYRVRLALNKADGGDRDAKFTP